MFIYIFIYLYLICIYILMSLTKAKHKSRFDLWVMACNPWLDSEAWKAKVFQDLATVYCLSFCFPILPLYTALAKLKCLPFTANHL